jgi:hypothetical protein
MLRTRNDKTHYIDWDEPRSGHFANPTAKAICGRRVEAALDSIEPECEDCQALLKRMDDQDDVESVP